MAFYRMLQDVEPLKVGDVVMSDSTVHWGLVRLATPTRPHMHINIGPGGHFYGPFLNWPTQKKWVENGIAEQVAFADLSTYLPHFTKRMWLLATPEGFDLRCLVWNEYKAGKPKRRIEARGFAFKP